MEHPWLFARCREIQNNPDGYLDLWAREHYKSTVITFGKTLQDIIASHGQDPIMPKDLTIGIFSHNRPTAKKFLSHIKNEVERNEHLRELFPDVIWENPGREAPKWSMDSGLIFKRTSNPKEATLEAYGLIDGMPTGGHFDLLIYDDVVTLDVVRSTEMITKVTEALSMSYNLGARGGQRRMIGTRYHFADTYKTVMDRGTFTPRLHPATADGSVDGEPVLLTRDELAAKRRDQGPYVFACQQLQNPAVDSAHGFQREWLRHYQGHNDGAGMNIYILVDPASEKKKTSDYTAMAVIGLGGDKNYYLLDAVYDRLNLTERTSRLMDLHKQWRPIGVGYERYGKDSDIEHIEYVQNEKNYRFDITRLGGPMAKNDRIKRLIPIFETSRFYMPAQLWRPDYEGRNVDIIEKFLTEEYDLFPVAVHDDMFDCIARIVEDDMNTMWPMLYEDETKREGRYGKRKRGTSWAA